MELTKQRTFTTRSLIFLIIPIMAECLLSQLVGMVDGIMVSSVGEVAISAVSLVNNIVAVLLNLLTALANGGSIVTSQLIGAGDIKKAKRSTGQVITMSVMVSVAVSSVCLLFNRSLLLLIFGKVEQAVLDDAVTYFFYNAMSLPFLALCAAGGAILRSKGDSKTMFYVSLLRNVVNVAGNAVCIYGFKMGVAGVAIPTALSRIVGAAILMLIVLRKNHSLSPEFKDIIHINPKLMVRMLRVGVPTAVENSLFQLGKLMTVSMISGFGTAQIAANSTAGALVGFVTTFSMAIRIGSMNVIGQCVGARNEEQIKLNFKRLLIMSYVVNAFVATISLLIRNQLVGLYSGLSPDAAKLAVKLMCIHIIPSMLLYPLAFYIVYPLRASNDGAFCMWVSILSMAIFRLTLAQILCVRMGMGAVGVWIAMVVDWVCRGTCFTWRWCKGSWKKKCNLYSEN